MCRPRGSSCTRCPWPWPRPGTQAARETCQENIVDWLHAATGMIDQCTRFRICHHALRYHSDEHTLNQFSCSASSYHSHGHKISSPGQYTYLCTCIYMHACACMHACTRVHVINALYLHMHIYVCICMRTCICMTHVIGPIMPLCMHNCNINIGKFTVCI